MVLFRAGDQAQAFVIVLQGRIEVRLTSVSGREMLLYAVEAGQSCVQTTLGLLGDEVYTGTALTTSETLAVLVPKAVFLSIMDQDKGFRRFVLPAMRPCQSARKTDPLSAPNFDPPCAFEIRA